jgi:YVTN family beta-propeller protein
MIMKKIFPEKKWYINSWKLFFIIGLIGFLSISCGVDDPSYEGRPASRSFIDERFTYDDIQIEGVFLIVESEHPSCSFKLEFLNSEQIKTPNRTYKYVIEDGIIHIIDPADGTSVLATLEIHPQNPENSEFISVIHSFRDRDAAEESGMWIGEFPTSGSYQYEAGWYRAKMEVGYRPYDIVLVSTANGDYLYVTNAFENTVSVIRTLDNTVVKTIAVGRNPKRLAATPDGSHVYVVNTEDREYGTVSVLRTSDHANIRTIPVGIRPYGVTVSPDGSYVYITETHENLIRVIQTSDHTVLATIPLSQDSMEYAEVYFGDLINSSDYSIIAIEGECGPLSKVPDMTDPICRKNPNIVECPLKCPSTVGKVGAVMRNVEPDENGYWFSGFLNNRFQNGTITLMLVENFTGAEGMDLDLDDNGILDYEESPETLPPWQNIVDEVAVNNYTTGGRCYSDTVIQTIPPFEVPFINGKFQITGGYSRIPNGIDTDSVDDWTRNNNYSSWLHSAYADNDILNLINIPETDKAYNSPGEQNLLYGQASETITTNHPVINEFLLNRGEYRPLGLTAPREIQEDEDNYIYLSTEENIILKIRLSDYAVLERINLGINAINYSNTTDMTVLPGGDLYLVDEKNSSVAVIREEAVIKKVPVGFTPFGITSSFDGRYVFVTSIGIKFLTVIRTSDNSVTEMIPLLDTSTGVAAPRSGNYVYVTNENENTVSVVVYTDDAVCN